MVERMESALAEVQSAIEKSKLEMAQYYNRRHAPPPIFNTGDKVYLDASDIKTTRPSQKLAHRRLGPYEVLSCVGNNAYHL